MIVHTTKATLQNTSIPKYERLCLLVNFEKCFNQWNGAKILEEVRVHFLKLWHWVETYYGKHSSNLGDEILTSKAKVQHGDPLGPFALLPSCCNPWCSSYRMWRGCTSAPDTLTEPWLGPCKLCCSRPGTFCWRKMGRGS